MIEQITESEDRAIAEKNRVGYHVVLADAQSYSLDQAKQIASDIARCTGKEAVVLTAHSIFTPIAETKGKDADEARHATT